ncbi:deoxyribodipyrimidine photo-lyase [Simiduia agarivorans]|uniref:Deoxyribodipyrimidine photo-lyase n=1 Tax=Simiduia agarivorans (strain DSM 21679 / JCM 13881 / BCRC 17597 / SA1) TaxID=1117647 RepID=K4KWJ1_SIMAS|nr:deoxyribodipyrimidine photo-lyase [Simiduia agarivorans]AFU98292.2 deoxyribodipyrimidine photo-lyase [Simiduia agarivorans SA1 = DSM 21679]
MSRAKHPNQLIWFRNDLRVTDHPALTAACQSAMAEGGRVHAVFVCTTQQWQRHDWGVNKRDFVYRSVLALGQQLRELGITLHVLQVPLFSQCAEAVVKLALELGAGKVVWHREVGWDERQRDLAVRKRCTQENLATEVLDDRLLVPPESVLTGGGTPFKVFTPYKRRWLEALKASGVANLPKPRVQPGKVNAPTISRDAFGLSEDVPAMAALWPAGESEAHKRLVRFTRERLMQYGEQRDFPALEGTSGLSPYLAVGAISARQCAHAWLLASEGDWHHPRSDVWLSELGWRDFYQYIMWHFPRVSRNQPFVEKTRQLAWRSADEDFLAWCQGRTGIPLVDAAMRQLHATGWMHNRLRMVVAMFLTKNLLVDWRRGEAYFMQQLVDGDFAANNGGWQWSASTGTDAAPYFRVFNPVSQSQRFDPEGQFIRHWLPELAHLDNKQIHLPKPALRGDYPAPIVDLKLSRQQAIDAFAAL